MGILVEYQHAKWLIYIYIYIAKLTLRLSAISFLCRVIFSHACMLSMVLSIFPFASLTLYVYITCYLCPGTFRVVGAPQLTSATIFCHLRRSSAALWLLLKSRPVHSLMLSSHIFLCLPLFLFPGILCLVGPFCRGHLICWSHVRTIVTSFVSQLLIDHRKDRWHTISFAMCMVLSMKCALYVHPSIHLHAYSSSSWWCPAL